MSRQTPALLVIMFLSLCIPALADLAAIQKSALPQESAILVALEDARELEPYSSYWTPTWSFPISKQEVARRLGKDLAVLSAALKEHPKDEELQLLGGLIAHYGYNMDVPGSQNIVLQALKQAQTLAPADVRGPWFHASFACQTTQSLAGAEEFLSIEDNTPWQKLPSGFWNDYLECALITNMPVHALRAAAHLRALDVPISARTSQLSDLAAKRLTPFDPNVQLEAKDVWYATNIGKNITFTSTLCGLRVTARSNWNIDILRWDHDSCVADLRTGPYKGSEHKLQPNLLVLVQRPQENEPLQDYFQKFLKKGTFEPFTPTVCPAQVCLAMKAVQPEMYAADGGGRGRVIAFERSEPEFPGLPFEFPMGPPDTKQEKSPQFFRPSQTRQRIPGKLYYLVLLDTAASIEDPALGDLDFFLKNLSAE